jgi:hypothetical protein
VNALVGRCQPFDTFGEVLAVNAANLERYPDLG